MLRVPLPLASLTLLTVAVGALHGVEPDAGTAQHRLLNPLDAASLPGMGAWMVDNLAVRIATEPARFGSAAVTATGAAKCPGAKVDIPLFDGELAGCSGLALWAAAAEGANVQAVGFQIRDAKGEWLMRSAPLAAAGWNRVTAAPTDEGWKQAWEQKEHDGKIDLPITSVHAIWFTAAAGATTLTLDALSARVAPGAGGGVGLTLPPELVQEPGRALRLPLLAENLGATAQPLRLRWTLQADAQLDDTPVPDPLLGTDLVAGRPAPLTVDGVERGDSRLADGDETSSFETSWGSNAAEVVATIDLGAPRPLSAVKWLAGDANWIFQADLSTSLDGKTFAPVAGAQGVDLHGKWGGPHAFPWPGKAVSARYLRLRFHRAGTPAECFRLPVSIFAYDGTGDEKPTVPTVGTVVASGTAEASVPARDFTELVLEGTAPLAPGAYLLGLEQQAEGRTSARWCHVLVRPTEAVDQQRARRFGINGAEIEYAAEMQRCGFGWMRFENAKWQMYAPERGKVAFDGSVAPWHVPLDTVFRTYQTHGMNTLPYVFQPPEWATGAPPEAKRNRDGYPPKDPADYGEAVYQLVARYGTAKVPPQTLMSPDKATGLGLIQAVELWNEPNLNSPDWGPFVGTLEQYFTVLRAGAEGSRRADPKLPVSAAGWAGIDLDIVGTLAEHRYADGKTPLDLVDIVNVHFYSARQEPETCSWDPNVQRDGKVESGTTYPEQLDDLVEWRDRLKPGAEIWLTETGNDVGGPMGRTERHQAAKVPRAIMLALAAGVEKVFIYREKGSSPTQHAGAGLLRNDGSVRPQWFTVATMIRQLQGFNGRALRLPTKDPATWLLLWQDGDRRLLTAWTTGDSTSLGLELGKATVTDSFGSRRDVARTADLAIGYFPTYVTLASTPALERLVTEARARDAKRSAERTRLAKTPISLFDFGPSARIGVQRGFGAPRRFTAVGKDALWNDGAGFGFAAPAAGDEDRHWIADPLEGDSCRMTPDTVFRFRLPAGSHTLKISATKMDDKGITVRVAGPGGPWTATTSDDRGLAELTVTGGAQPLELTLADWGRVRWLSAVPVP